MFKVALLSRWHPHSMYPDERYAKDLLSQPDCKITCVWDRDAQIAEQWGKQYGVDWTTELEEVLSRDDVDGVLVTSQPADHREIFISAARHHKHIFTEKVLSLKLDEALEIKEAVEKAGINFAIAYMRLAIPQLAYAKQLVESKAIGEPVSFRCVCGHAQGLKNTLPEYWYDPEICGGGAMIDLGFNCAYLAGYIMGGFETVSASFSNKLLGKRVEDFGSCTVRFKNGASGILEATFDSPMMSVFEMNVYGTKGAYYARFGGGDIAELNIEGRARQILDIKQLPCPLKTPVATWVETCKNGSRAEPYGIESAVDLVRFMHAAYLSDQNEGKRFAL